MQSIRYAPEPVWNQSTINCTSSLLPNSYLLACLFTLLGRVLPEKLIVSQLVKKFIAFYETQRFITLPYVNRIIAVHRVSVARTYSNKCLDDLAKNELDMVWKEADTN